MYIIANILLFLGASIILWRAKQMLASVAVFACIVSMLAATFAAQAFGLNIAMWPVWLLPAYYVSQFAPQLLVVAIIVMVLAPNHSLQARRP